MPAGDAAYLTFDGVDLYFPAVLSESSEHTSSVTEHVVEEGANVTDHVRGSPVRISLEVFLTNTPITVGGPLDMQTTFVELDVPKVDKPILPTPGSLIQAGAAALDNFLNGKPVYKAAVLKAQKPGPNLVKETLALLDTWRKDAVLGQVIMPWGFFKDMVITKLTPQRDASTGDAAKVSIELQQIRLVEAKLVTAPVPTEIRGFTMVAKGKQPPEPVREDGPKKTKTILKGGADKVRGRR